MYLPTTGLQTTTLPGSIGTAGGSRSMRSIHRKFYVTKGPGDPNYLWGAGTLGTTLTTTGTGSGRSSALRSTQAADLITTNAAQIRAPFVRQRSFHDAEDLTKYQQLYTGIPLSNTPTAGQNQYGSFGQSILSPQFGTTSGPLQGALGQNSNNYLNQFMAGTPNSNFGLSPIQVTQQGIDTNTLNASPLGQMNFFGGSNTPTYGSRASLGVGMHDPSLPTSLMPVNNPNAFHGKSMRSIQLFNNNTSASPPQLHPSMNPTVEAESPRSKRINATQHRGGGFSLQAQQVPLFQPPTNLNIHNDSCYNFLNKRRFNQDPSEHTPLEGFFLKESLAQYKVARQLASRGVSQYPTNRPPVRRTKQYLLVLDIDETLVHSEPMVENSVPNANSTKQYDKTVTFNNPNGTVDVYGVRFRPHMMEFIQRMSRLYDLAVYTASARDYADAVMDSIDPSRSIFCARLYREHCIPMGQMNIKNMANFDGKNVFLLDNLIYSFAFNIDQGIPICAFVDDPQDVELQDLAEMLENLPNYESLNALLQDLLGLNEFYQALQARLGY